MKRKQLLIKRLLADMRRASRHVGHGRLVRLGVATLLIGSLMIPVLQQIYYQQLYMLDAATRELVGTTNPNLAKKFSYDAVGQRWQFNKAGMAPDLGSAKSPDEVAAALKSQVGGGGEKDDSLYAVNLPADGQKGVTYYDSNTKLSFTLVPQFDVRAGQEREGQLIYPIPDGGKLIYSAKNNGMKEDIVLSHNIGDSLQFTYKLDLPDTLEAKLLDDGSVGVYSADPSLFGNIQFGSEADQAKIERARQTAPKNHLVFNIPAPIIKQTGDEQVKATARFSLAGNELKIYATNMNSLTYPATVDPSVLVTSSSDFSSGNNEGNIDFASGQASRGGLTGATVGAWSTTNSFSSSRYGHQSIAYNGYLYVVGGSNSKGVEYAQIDSGGTGALGSWASTTSMPYQNFADGLGVTVYNGYMYAVGGMDEDDYGILFTHDVYYAPIATNGTLGAWTATSKWVGPNIMHFPLLASGGYLYAVGGDVGTPGQASSSPSATVHVAPIKANGAVGTWTTTSTLNTARYSHTAVVYGDCMYVMNGYNGGALATTEYAHINTDGTLGTWTVGTPTPTAQYGGAAVAVNGYVYVLGGDTGSAKRNDVQYAMINANGSLGTWATTTAFATGRVYLAASSYGGYLYMLGGTNGGTGYSDVQYAKISAAGSVSPAQTTTALPTTLNRQGSIAYNGYLYVVGGATGGSFSSRVATVYYAPLNNDGSVGTWNTTSSLVAANRDVEVEIYGGYMYELDFGSNKIQYAKINTNGTLGTWAYTTTLPSGSLQFPGFAAYNGYLYVTGGWDQTTDYNYVQYAPINSNGTVGTWHYTHNSTDDGTTFVDGFNIARRSHTTVAYNGYLYVIGGITNIGTYGTLDDVQYAPINANGTIGSWTTDSSSVMLDAGRYYTADSVYNGCLYIYGGIEVSNTVTADVDYACFNANGTMTSWTTTSALTSSRDYLSGAMYNGYIYGIAGRVSGTPVSTVDYARINNGGSGGVGTWTATSSFTTGRDSMGAVAYNGYMYIVGGGDCSQQTPCSDVQYAQINSDGTVGTWSGTTGLPNPRMYGAAVAYNGYLYYFGGKSDDEGPAPGLQTVYYAPINSNGTVGTWDTTTQLATTLINMGAVAYNGYMYILGGSSGSSGGGTFYNTVRYATINSDGTLGSWTATNSFTTARSNHGAVAYNGYMYIMGGGDSGVLSSNFIDVQYAPINSNGTLGTWASTMSLPTSRTLIYATVYDGKIYVTGGYDTAILGDVLVAPINSNGTLGRWWLSTGLPSARYKHSSIAYGGYLYVLGGYNAGNFNDVQYAPIYSIARTARYSKLIDLGTSATLNSISFNGTLTGGAKSIVYRVAGDDGIFGATATIDTITGGDGDGGTTCGGGGSTVRYVWVSVTIDDSGGAVYQDTSSTFGNLTDITVDYEPSNNGHAPPNLRMHGGKYFSSESLRPLDTCGA